jgi:Biotin/lipoate A/B protein ligase family
MPLETKSRPHTAFARRLDLPPPFRLVTLREVGDAFAHAAAVAADEGAGTLVHVGRFDLAEFAVVLEPEEPLRIARRAIYAGTCALGDALAANAPPEKAIGFAWPDAIRVDGGLVGGVRLAWPADAEEDEPPAPGKAGPAKTPNPPRYDINENGDLLVRYADTRVERRSLIDALAVPSWLDPATGGPRR